MTRRAVHAIEQESYAILRSRVDLRGLPPLSRAVVERVVHASADLDYVTDLVCEEKALEAGAHALRAGAPVVADVEMVAAGIPGHDVICRLGAAEPNDGDTRAAAGVRAAALEAGRGAVWVVGCAPTALFALLAVDVRPALVVGLPVGFVGAAESKAALRASRLPSLSNVSAKGGSAVAAAAINALRYVEELP